MAKKGQLSNSYLSEIKNNKKINPSIETLQKISTALEIPIEELIKDKCEIKEEYVRKEKDYRNMPTQKAADMGLFFVKETSLINPDGSIRITKTTKVTGKGQVYFISKLKKGLLS